MRKLLALAAVAVALLAWPATIAFAQTDGAVRDPFVPLIEPSPIATGTDPTVPVQPPVPVDPVLDPNEPLPGTGSQAATWIGLGYVLVALGAGTVIASKSFGPLRIAGR